MEEEKVYSLEKIWQVQETFNNNFVRPENLSLDEKQKYTKEYVLHIVSELDEVLREINWKLHRKNKEEVIRQNLIEEIVDVFKYWCSLAQMWDITPEEFSEEFRRKSLVVEQRYKQERQLKLLEDKNVIGVDIDGVLADYPNCFYTFIRETLGKEYTECTTEEYVKTKHEYRSSGYKKNLPLIEGAIEGMKKLKQAGYTIVLLTARPYHKYPRMFADTIDWLTNNNIPYDALLWNENKEEAILKEFPNMRFFIEDNLENATKISSKGKTVYLLNSKTKIEKLIPHIIAIHNWEELISEIGLSNEGKQSGD